MLIGCFKYVETLVAISVLVRNDHPEIRRHIGFK
jgi:hypothetical protein